MFRRLKYKLGEKRFERRMSRQRYKNGFSDDDCWAMDWWLTNTFPKMILHLRDMKHGAPEETFEEFDTLPKEWKDAELEVYKYIQEKNGYEYEPDSIFTKWYIILTRMAYCLREADKDKEVYNPYERDYNKAIFGEDFFEDRTFEEFRDKFFEKTDIGYELKTNEVDAELKEKYIAEEEKIWEYKESMKNEGLDLLKKYFYNLWD